MLSGIGITKAALDASGVNLTNIGRIKELHYNGTAVDNKGCGVSQHPFAAVTEELVISKMKGFWK